MTNRALEKFFSDILGQSYLDLMKKNIITPTRKISSEFFKPCLLEEIITINLHVTKISRSTVELLFEFTGDEGEKRLTVHQLIVFVDHQKMKSISLPNEITKILQDYMN
jgi:acyl-CoA thioesterase FadM